VRALAVVIVATAAPLIGAAAAQAAITGTELRSTTLSIPGTMAIKPNSNTVSHRPPPSTCVLHTGYAYCVAMSESGQA
jgi:hypothetical protein